MKPDTKKSRLDITLSTAHVERLDELCAAELRTRSAQVGYMIENWSKQVNPVNLKDAQALTPAKVEEPKRPVGRPPVAAPQSTRKKHPVGDVVFIRDAALIAEGQEWGTCTSAWLVKTPIGTAGDIFWVNAYPVCERDPDHPCGFKPPHAFAIDESHLPYVRSQIANLGTPGGYQPLTKPEPPASSYFDGYIDGNGFDTEEDALAWVWEQMEAGKGDEMWIKHGIRP